MNKTMWRSALAVSCVALATGIAGCGRSLNDRVDLIGVEPLPALSGDALTAPRTGGAPMSSLSRDDWPAVTVLVPTHQTEHHPTYVHNRFIGEPSPRRAGAYPTAQSALDTPADLAATGYGEFFCNLGDSAWSIVSWPVMVFSPGNHPMSVHRGPDEPCQWLAPVESHPRALNTAPASAELTEPDNGMESQ